MKFRNPISADFVVELAAAAVKKIRNRPKAVARRAAKAAKRAKRDGPLPDDSGEFLDSDQEVSAGMSGLKTYTGLVVTAIGLVLGWLGVGDADGSLAAQIAAALDQVLTVGGLLFAAYGRAKAKPAP